MRAPTALGSQVELADGRLATVVYNSLCGVGAKIGLHDPSPEDFDGTSGDMVDGDVPEDWPWRPDVLLREPWRWRRMLKLPQFVVLVLLERWRL